MPVPIWCVSRRSTPSGLLLGGGAVAMLGDLVEILEEESRT
jgi:hypothetical protein